MLRLLKMNQLTKVHLNDVHLRNVHLRNELSTKRNLTFCEVIFYIHTKPPFAYHF